MLFNKALVLSANNWKVMVKALICQTLILALACALCFLLFGGLVEDVIKVLSTVDWNGFLEDTITSIANGSFNAENFAQALNECLQQTQAAIEAMPNIWNRVEVSYAMCIVLFLLYRMLISFSDVAVGFQLQEFMTSNASRPFTWYLVKKLGEALKFILLQMLLTLPLDLVIVFGSIGMGLVFALTLKWWAIIPAALIVLVLYSARHTYFAFWLPSIVTDGEGVRKGLTKGCSVIPCRFLHVFWKTFMLICIMAAIFVLSVMYIENNILKLVVGVLPNLILFFLLKCINLVEYFEATKRPYFYKTVMVEGTERFNKRQERLQRKENRKSNKN